MGFFSAGLCMLRHRRNLIPDALLDSLERYNRNFPREKVYLHFDRPYYYTKENVWFQAYLVAGPLHEPSPFSTSVYIELFSEEIERWLLCHRCFFQMARTNTLCVAWRFRSRTNQSRRSSLRTDSLLIRNGLAPGCLELAWRANGTCIRSSFCSQSRMPRGQTATSEKRLRISSAILPPSGLYKYEPGRIAAIIRTS